MMTDREAVVDVLRSHGEHDRALEAQCTLPQWVDVEEDAGVLQQLGVSPSELAD